MDNSHTTFSTKTPVSFENFFELGQEETCSPFLTSSSRLWGANLTLKASSLAAILLFISFLLSFYPNQLALSHLLLTLVYFLVGIPALIESIEDLSNFEINIDILMTLAAFSSILIGSGMEGGLLLVLFALSGSMEDWVTHRAKNAISSLSALSPNKACVIESDGRLLERALRDIPVGARILIKSGQIVPLDGEVIAGISSVNLAHLTGESIPITKQAGDSVAAGARNLEGSLTLRVTYSSADSTLARIIQLVTQAQEERPLLQRWFDRLSKGYAVAIIGLATCFAITFPFLLDLPFFGVGGSLYRALSFLIAASPCALIIAIPIAYLSAIGACARQGILLKGGITLDALARCSQIAFDKTGTLTTGILQLIAIKGVGSDTNISLDQALAVAYALEKNAMHPIAKAVVAYGEQHQLPQMSLKEFKAVVGYGVRAVWIHEGMESPVSLGQLEYICAMLDKEAAKKLREEAILPIEQGEVIAVLLIETVPFLMRFRDTLRPHIRTTIQGLQKGNQMEIVMLTGDHENSARQIAKEVGIEHVKANLKPEDKLHYVSKAAATKGLIMVGDGINDAPALARATVGICMGKVGSTPAIDAADVIFLHDNIERINWLLRKAYQTKKVVKQNLVLATLAIFVASIPALGGLIPLWLAVVLHEGGTVLVGLNGLRLLVPNQKNL